MKKNILLIVVICSMFLMIPACKRAKPPVLSFDETKIGTYKGMSSVEATYGIGAVTTSKLLSTSFSNGMIPTALSNIDNANNDYNLPSSSTEAVVKAQAEAESFNRYFNMLNDFLDKTEITTTITLNDSTEPELANYQYKLVVSSPNYQGNGVITHTLYYSETEYTPSNLHLDKNETYKGYQINGVMLMEKIDQAEPEYYEISGIRSEETEIEGKEVEIASEFTIKASLKNDVNNYVIMSCENEFEQEANEVETEKSYEYRIYQNGQVKEVTKIDFETENTEVEYEVEFLNGTSKGHYEIEKVTRNNTTWIEVEYNIDNNRGKFVIIEKSDGTYDYKFSTNPNDDRVFNNYGLM